MQPVYKHSSRDWTGSGGRRSGFSWTSSPPPAQVAIMDAMVRPHLVSYLVSELDTSGLTHTGYGITRYFRSAFIKRPKMTHSTVWGRIFPERFGRGSRNLTRLTPSGEGIKFSCLCLYDSWTLSSRPPVVTDCGFDSKGCRFPIGDNKK